MLFVLLSVANDVQQSKARLPLLLCFLAVVHWHNIAAICAVRVAGECLHANRNIFLMHILKLSGRMSVFAFIFILLGLNSLIFSKFLSQPSSWDLLQWVASHRVLAEEIPAGLSRETLCDHRDWQLCGAIPPPWEGMDGNADFLPAVRLCQSLSIGFLLLVSQLLAEHVAESLVVFWSSGCPKVGGGCQHGGCCTQSRAAELGLRSVKPILVAWGKRLLS